MYLDNTLLLVVLVRHSRLAEWLSFIVNKTEFTWQRRRRRLGSSESMNGVLNNFKNSIV